MYNEAFRVVCILRMIQWLHQSAALCASNLPAAACRKLEMVQTMQAHIVRIIRHSNGIE